MLTISMNALERFAIVILSMSLVVYSISNIFSFFGIGYDVYGIYMLTFITLSIFVGVLPQNVGGIFSK